MKSKNLYGIRIIDVLGRELRSITIEADFGFAYVDIADLSSGIYFIIDENGKAKSFVKE